MRGWCVQWTLKRKWQHWRQLAAWERRVLLALGWRLPLAWLLLRVAGVPRLLGIASRPLGKPDNGIAEVNVFVERCGELADTAARVLPFPVSCLPTSLALCHLLRSRGVDVQLRIGVQRNHRNDAMAIDAHAWVEHAGKPVGLTVAGYHAIL